jgi:rare lipoprotein A
MHYTRVIAAVTLIIFTAACGTSQPQKPPYRGIKIGKPYEIYGRWYEPAYNAHYDEIGMASWYGPGFNGGKTSYGDRFDQEQMTAAHRTLPLPSIVRVTNLETGQSALVKVNDRGPFSHDRIIDLSRAAAKKLGILRKGTGRVRVQFLDAETRAYVKSIQEGSSVDEAMDQVGQINPEEASARQVAAEQPHLELGSRMFGGDSSPEVAASDATVTPASVTEEPPQTYTPPATLTTVPTYPTPPRVRETREAAATAQPALEPLPPPAYPPSLAEHSPAQQPPHYSDDEFAVIDNTPPAPQLVRIPEENPGQSGQYMPAIAPFAAPGAMDAHARPGGGGVFIQAGTFSRAENARNLEAKLASLGSARVSRVVIGSKTMYRVTIGPFNTQENAKNMLSKVAAMGIPDARITHN